MGIKVNVKWGKKNTKGNYSCKGKTLKDVERFLLQRGHAGKFDFRMGNQYRMDNDGNITSITLIPSWKITMPKWSGYSKVSKDDKKAWDHMWKELFKHEDGHREIFEKDLKKFAGKLKKQKNLDEDRFQELFDEAIEHFQDGQDHFDKKTNHGAEHIHFGHDH